MESQTIVEIGPNVNPIHNLFGWETFEKIRKGYTYIAIDCDQEQLRIFKKMYKERAAVGDLRNLPLRSNSVDQIWLMSVFGGFQSIPKKLPNGMLEYRGFSDGIFQELSRVTKRGGKIYIGELYVPMCRNLMWLADEDYSGFGLEKKVYKGREEVKPYLEKLTGNPVNDFLQNECWRDYSPFFIELTKK